MKEPKKLSSERFVQAKAFLENGVITEEQFIEMTHGQVEPEAMNESKVLGMIFDRINKIEQRLLGIESSISLLVQDTRANKSSTSP